MTLHNYIEEREKLLDFLWGIAPTGSLKDKKGKEIKDFHRQSLLGLVKEIEEFLSKTGPLIKKVKADKDTLYLQLIEKDLADKTEILLVDNAKLKTFLSSLTKEVEQDD